MNWQRVKVGDLCDLVRGSSPRPKNDPRYYGGPIPRLMVADVTRDGFLVTPQIDSLTEAGAKLSRPVKAGTVVMAVSGNVGLMSRLAVDACIHDGFVGFVNLSEKVQPRYFMWLMTHLKGSLAQRTAGAIFQNTTTAAIKELEIPLPPLEEQQRIANRLDAADRLRAQRRDAVATLDALTHSLFLDMFGDPAHNPKNWPMVKLADACLDKGKYGSGASATEFREGKPRYIRITDIEESGRLKPSKMAANDLTEKDLETYKLRVGDVLFARSGATVGKTYKYEECDGDCIYAGYLIRFRPNPEKLTAEFLFSFTGTSHYKSWVSSKQRVVAQPNINAQQYGYDLEIPLPPLELQREFALRLDAIEAMRARMAISALELDALFASLQSAAFES